MRSSLIRLLRERAGASANRLVQAMVVEGVGQSALIVVLNQAAENFDTGGSNFRYLVLFIVFVIAVFTAKKYVGEKTAELAQNAVHDIRIRISDKVRHSKLIVFEEVDPSRLNTVLTEESDKIIQGAVQLAKSVPSLVMLIGSFAYIAYLSQVAFFLSLIGIVAAVLATVAVDRSNAVKIHESMAKENEFFDLLYHQLGGFKELKMSRRKSDDLFHNFLARTGALAKSLRIEAENNVVKVSLVVYVSFMLIMAINVFILPRFRPLPPDIIVSIMTVLIFVVGHLGILGDSLPQVTRADLALKSIYELEELLDRGADSNSLAIGGDAVPRPLVEGIELRDVDFQYQEKGAGEGFEVGPINMSVKPGEIVFITGGNGSGKSTLLKLIAGLYYPDRGTLAVGGRELEPEDYPNYRELFSIVTTDFHLFDRLYGFEEDEVDRDRLERELRRLDLDTVTRYVDGRFSNIKLSTGQRKRLALIIALIEDRPLLIFDEVAADQDPGSRRYFYEVLLSELREQGKTVIAATHDDAYFHVADRVLHMEYGKLVS